MLVLSVISQT